MTPTERELRIQRDALTAANKWDRRLTSSHIGFEAGYIAGATAEHDKARNQAIQECIDIVSRTQFYLGYNPTEALEQLKTKP